MIILDQRIRQLLIEDATNTFPDECCGFLFGIEEHDGTRRVIDLLVVDNSKEGDKTRRFEISPLDYLTAEQHALDHDWTLLGIYHSHPKHPAIPSEHDRKAAQPFFSYVIVSVLEVPEKSASAITSGASASHDALTSADTIASQPGDATASRGALVASDAPPAHASGAITIRSWLLNDEQQFEEEKITDYQLS